MKNHRQSGQLPALLILFAVLPAAAQLPQTNPYQLLIEHCAARTDARMDTMTLGKLDQIRNFEFSLRMAMTQVAAGQQALSAVEWQQAKANLQRARRRLSEICEVPLPQ